MSETDVHFPESGRRNAEANQDYLQTRDQINWKKMKNENVLEQSWLSHPIKLMQISRL